MTTTEESGATKNGGRVVSVELPGFGSLQCRKPNKEEYDRYLKKVSDRRSGPGNRELAQCCAVSHSPEEAADLIGKFPGVASKLAAALEREAGSDSGIDVDFDAREITVTLKDGKELVFGAADVDQWESFEESLDESLDDKDIHPAERYRSLLSDLHKGKEEDLLLAFSVWPAFPPLVVSRGIAQLAGFRLQVDVKKLEPASEPQDARS